MQLVDFIRLKKPVFSRFGWRNRSSAVMVLLAGAVAAGLAGCGPACNGSIETTVLYARPGAKGGRNIYVDVTNKPGLGVKKTLLWEGQEFGTFEHVVIIADPTNAYAANRKICFSTYQPAGPETGGQLEEEGIPRIRLEK